MKRIYVAGPFSANNVIDILANMRRGIKMSYRVFKKGYAPFVPWFDHQFSLVADDNEQFEVREFYDYSLAWLEVSDAVLVLPNYEHSKGTLAEIEKAKELNIPIYYSLEELEHGMPKV